NEVVLFIIKFIFLFSETKISVFLTLSPNIPIDQGYPHLSVPGLEASLLLANIPGLEASLLLTNIPVWEASIIEKTPFGKLLLLQKSPFGKLNY
ncbi:Vitellogenin, partial [Armadillidium vulgare]